MLKEKVKLNVNKQMIRKYLKCRLGLSYKIIKPITVNHNYSVNKLKRQYSSSKYIEFLYEGKRIINIDESIISDSDPRKRGWWFPNTRNQHTRNQRINNVNLIFGISSKGEFFYTVNSGKTNSDTFFWFILRLVH